ncbi:hypothetical protein A3Q36_12420 [Geobacillus stearothermophilus]|nr:hypothetical protein A3Q36_12420 [Geobacillus stearothermophilus]
MDEGCPKSDGAPFLSSVHALALLYNESIVKRDMALLQRFFYSEISRRHIFPRSLLNPANPSFFPAFRAIFASRLKADVLLLKPPCFFVPL